MATTDNSTHPKPSGKPRLALSASDMIAFTALTLSLVSFAWQVANTLRGPELNLLDIKGRVVELRCVGSASDCWRKSGSRSPSVSVVAPVFAVNLGATGENEVLERALLTLQTGTGDPVRLVGHTFWKGTSGGNSGDRAPFEPIFVPGGGVEGEEVRFTAFSQADRMPWTEFAGAVIDGTITEVEVTLTVSPLIEHQEQEVRCTAPISDRARAALTARRENGRAAYLTLVCR